MKAKLYHQPGQPPKDIPSVVTHDAAMRILRRACPNMLKRTASTATVRCTPTSVTYECVCGSRHKAVVLPGRAKGSVPHVQRWKEHHACCAIALATRLIEGKIINIHTGK